MIVHGHMFSGEGIKHVMLAIKKKFGKNAILKAMNLEEGATAKERNKTIGGHRAGDTPEKS